MSTRKKWFFGFFLMLALTACLWTQAGKGCEQLTRYCDASDMPSYGWRGPHRVGKRDSGD